MKQDIAKLATHVGKNILIFNSRALVNAVLKKTLPIEYEYEIVKKLCRINDVALEKVFEERARASLVRRMKRVSILTEKGEYEDLYTYATQLVRSLKKDEAVNFLDKMIWRNKFKIERQIV